MKKLLTIICFLLLVCSSCNDPKDVSPILTDEDNQTKVVDNQLFLLNEGNFGNGVATLTKILSTDSSFTAENNVFQSNNDEFLGNVAQSMKRVGDEYWLVINNSQKIIRCDLEMNKTGEIKGFNSPRYLASSDNKVYVSDLFEDSMYVVDRVTFTIEKKFHTGSWNEEILIYDEELWVTNADKSEISVFNTLDESLIASIPVVKQPLSINGDVSGNIWVLCNGGLLTQEDEPYLFKISPLTKEKIDSVNLSSIDGLPSRLSIFEDEVYILSQHIYEFFEGSLSKVVDGEGLNLYSFLASEQYFYYSDAKDFVSNGDLYRVNRSKSLEPERVQVGVIPGFVYQKE